MKTREQNSRSVNELQFELKYCERCGGLWLRPAGGGQVYCLACGRQMAELPSSIEGTRNRKDVPGAAMGSG